jgi:hypothetical protein
VWKLPKILHQLYSKNASVSSLIAMVDFDEKKSFVRSAPPQMKGTLCVFYVSFDVVQLGNFLVVQSIRIWLALVNFLDVVGLFGGWSEQPNHNLQANQPCFWFETNPYQLASQYFPLRFEPNTQIWDSNNLLLLTPLFIPNNLEILYKDVFIKWLLSSPISKRGPNPLLWIKPYTHIHF